MEIIKEGVSEGAETKGRLKVNNHIIIEDINSIENDDR